ncbi:MAG: hypothetical protein NC115_08330, partial [Bacteroidales bacterium]|nr:hypothetical protein [Bacteroidales bacterium]
EGLAEGLKEGEKKGRLEGLAEGEAKGRKEGILEMAKAMKARGMSISDITDMTGLQIDEISVL